MPPGNQARWRNSSLLSLRTLLAQPLMWLRLKRILVNQRYDWLSQDETRPLPLDIPSMPVQFR
ncbi:Lon protease family protein, partial [Erwinia amylovora]